MTVMVHVFNCQLTIHVDLATSAEAVVVQQGELKIYSLPLNKWAMYFYSFPFRLHALGRKSPSNQMFFLLPPYIVRCQSNDIFFFFPSTTPLLHGIVQSPSKSPTLVRDTWRYEEALNSPSMYN